MSPRWPRRERDREREREEGERERQWREGDGERERDRESKRESQKEHSITDVYTYIHNETYREGETERGEIYRERGMDG